MKRVIRAAKTGDSIMKSETGMFELVRDEGIGIHDTPWKGLKVKSYGPAEKHVVEIRLTHSDTPAFDGEPVKYIYDGAEVAHGMRGRSDTLRDTKEYIEVLTEALHFAEDIEEWLRDYYF